MSLTCDNGQRFLWVLRYVSPNKSDLHYIAFCVKFGVKLRKSNSSILDKYFWYKNTPRGQSYCKVASSFAKTLLFVWVILFSKFRIPVLFLKGIWWRGWWVHLIKIEQNQQYNDKVFWLLCVPEKSIARNHGYFCSCIFISQIASCMTSANKRWTIFGRRWSMNADENS